MSTEERTHKHMPTCYDHQSIYHRYILIVVLTQLKINLAKSLMIGMRDKEMQHINLDRNKIAQINTYLHFTHKNMSRSSMLYKITQDTVISIGLQSYSSRPSIGLKTGTYT